MLSSVSTKKYRWGTQFLQIQPKAPLTGGKGLNTVTEAIADLAAASGGQEFLGTLKSGWQRRRALLQNSEVERDSEGLNGHPRFKQ